MAHIICQHNAGHSIWGGDCDGWLLLKSPGLSIIKERVPPGRRKVRHDHQHDHQFFYVLSGEATLEIDGQMMHTAGTGFAGRREDKRPEKDVQKRLVTPDETVSMDELKQHLSQAGKQRSAG
ncbi:MAG: hypothetical protein KatS3mg057_0284 [Herpetosiphonaceae bacterium]|nr:MAG: hypothetical protein KatS3mg057_0284 [Herpetosiphonaceae bacterium]